MEVTDETLEKTLIQLKEMGVPSDTAIGTIGVLHTEEQFLTLQEYISGADILSKTELLITAMMIADGEM